MAGKQQAKEVSWEENVSKEESGKQDQSILSLRGLMYRIRTALFTVPNYPVQSGSELLPSLFITGRATNLPSG